MGVIANLFSIFDPFRQKVIRNFLFFFLFIFFFFFFKKKGVNRVYFLFAGVLRGVFKDLDVLIKKISFLHLIFSSLFLMLLARNYLGLIAYVFPRTRHLSLTLSFSVIFWARLFSVRILFNIKGFLGHLVPEGVSYRLAPGIVLIERLSNLIRPFILGVRISANMIAGHLLMALVSGLLGVSGRGSFILVFTAIVLLVVLERMVRVIQAYIFTILIGL